MAAKFDYRDSHTSEGKGDNYHDSFEEYSFRRTMWVWEQKILSEIFEERLKKDGTILDFACGTGRILTFLETQSKNVTGVDLSDSMLEVTRRNLPNIEVIQADLTRDNVLLKDKRQFDIITSFRFFLKAQDSLRVEVMEALTPLLKDDGYMIFNNHGPVTSLGVQMERFYGTLKSKIKNPRKKIVYDRMSHKRVKQLLENSGLEIIEMHHRSVYPIMNEKTKMNVSKFDKLENWFSSKKMFRPLARNVIYVCKKK